MAITNAQQYKQLLAKGGRIGFKGGADMGTVDAKDSKGNVTRAATSRSVNISPSGNVTTSRDDPSPAQQYIGGQAYDVTPETRDERDKLFELENQRKLREQKDFITAPANYPEYLPGYVKFLANLNRQPNRKYLVDKVLKGKNASKIITGALGLDEDGLAFAPDQLTASQLEQVMDTYMTDRMSGQTDAYGNPVTRDRDGGGNINNNNISGIIENLIQPGIFPGEESPGGFKYIPYSNQVVIAPGIEGLRSLMGSDAFKSIIK